MFGFFSNTFDNLKYAVSKTAKTLVGNVVDTVQEENEESVKEAIESCPTGAIEEE